MLQTSPNFDSSEEVHALKPSKYFTAKSMSNTLQACAALLLSFKAPAAFQPRALAAHRLAGKTSAVGAWHTMPSSKASASSPRMLLKSAEEDSVLFDDSADSDEDDLPTSFFTQEYFDGLSSLRIEADNEFGPSLTPCGGVRKRVLREADDDTEAPNWGAIVRIFYVGVFPNGTVFDKVYKDRPREWQLNTDEVVQGLEKGVKSMRDGEVARIVVDPKFAFGDLGVGGGFIPPNQTLVYDVQMITWSGGPPVDNKALDLQSYRGYLEGKEARSGKTAQYRWVERSDEVSFWIPLEDGERTRDIQCDIGTRKLSLRIGGDKGGSGEEKNARVEVSGELKGPVSSDDSYWIIDDEDGPRSLKVVLTKLEEFTKWEGVLTDEEQSEPMKVTEFERLDDDAIDPSYKQEMEDSVFKGMKGDMKDELDPEDADFEDAMRKAMQEKARQEGNA